MNRRGFLKTLGLVVGAALLGSPKELQEVIKTPELDKYDLNNFKLVKEGLTNHGKPFKSYYNEDTNMYVGTYVGSGTSGHEIPFNHF